MRSDGSPFEFYKFRPGVFDFWRCYSCGEIFTYEQERLRMALMEHDPKASMCRCLGMKYKPTRPRWYEWIRPSVLTYTVKLLLARGLAPWLEVHLPGALPLVERLVRPSMRG